MSESNIYSIGDPALRVELELDDVSHIGLNILGGKQQLSVPADFDDVDFDHALRLRLREGSEGRYRQKEARNERTHLVVG